MLLQVIGGMTVALVGAAAFAGVMAWLLCGPEHPANDRNEAQ